MRYGQHLVASYGLFYTKVAKSYDIIIANGYFLTVLARRRNLYNTKSLMIRSTSVPWFDGSKVGTLFTGFLADNSNSSTPQLGFCFTTQSLVLRRPHILG
jgi:hypothetical protein